MLADSIQKINRLSLLFRECGEAFFAYSEVHAAFKQLIHRKRPVADLLPMSAQYRTCKTICRSLFKDLKALLDVRSDDDLAEVFASISDEMESWNWQTIRSCEAATWMVEFADRLKLVARDEDDSGSDFDPGI
jgi:hypothetical protein